MNERCKLRARWGTGRSGRRFSLANLLALLCPLACVSCAETTQIRVDIVGEFQVPDDIQRLVVAFRGEELTFQTSHGLGGSSRQLFESLVVYPGSGLNERVEIQVLAHGDDRHVAMAAGNATFIPQQSQNIVMRLEPYIEDFSNADENAAQSGAGESVPDALYLRWLERRHAAP